MTEGDRSVWAVELTRRGADDMRAISPVTRAPVVACLESLRFGLPDHAVPDRRVEGAYRVDAGSAHVVRLLVRPEQEVILVVAIEPVESPAPSASRAPRVARWAGFATDVRHTVRGLLRAPAFTLAVVLTLAAGLGGAATIFGLLDTVFRGTTPFEDADRLVRIRLRADMGDDASRLFNVTPRDFHLVRDGNRSFEDVVAMRGGSVTLLGEGTPEHVQTVAVTAGWSALLGIEPMLGRAFTPDEEARGADAGVAMIGHALWQSRFGGEPDVVGGLVEYDGGAVRVVGVLQPRFAYPYDARIWIPERLDPADHAASDLNVVARLSPGVTVAEGNEDANRIYEALRTESPGVAPNAGFGVTSLRDDFIRDGGGALKSLAVAVAFLLLLVCANVANLFTARRLTRRREAALRVALGASQRRLVGSVVLESVLLFLLGGVLGVALVVPLGAGITELIPDVLRTQLDVADIRIGSGLLAFIAVLGLVAGCVTGGLAAWWGARTDVHDLLRDGGRGNSTSGGRLRDVLVVAELSLSLVLLVGAGVLFDHFRRLQVADLGFDTESLYTAQVTLEERYSDPAARLAVLETIETALSADPSVESVGITTVNPLCCGDWGAGVRVEGRERPADEPRTVINHKLVTPSYLESMRIPLTRGRSFTAADRIGGPAVVIVDEALADRFWPGEDPIGQRIGFDRADAGWMTVIGVVRISYAEGDSRQAWVLPLLQDPTARSSETVHVMVRVREGAAAIDLIRDAVAEVDPTLAVHQPASMSELRADLLTSDRLGSIISSALASAGLLLASLGLYGLLAYQVELRGRELGTRIALGAGRAEVVRTVLSRTARLLVAGLAIGSLLAYSVNELLVRTLDGVTLAGPAIFLPLLGVMITVAVGATLIPTWRALRVDPVQVLRGE